MILFNNNITRIGVYPKSRACRFTIEPSLRLVGIKYGFIPIFKIIDCVHRWGEFYSRIEDFKVKKYFIDDNDVFYKPHCIIFMNDQTQHEVFFETIDELTEYVKELKSKAPNIEV